MLKICLCLCICFILLYFWHLRFSPVWKPWLLSSWQFSPTLFCREFLFHWSTLPLLGSSPISKLRSIAYSYRQPLLFEYRLSSWSISLAFFRTSSLYFFVSVEPLSAVNTVVNWFGVGSLCFYTNQSFTLCLQRFTQVYRACVSFV